LHYGGERNPGSGAPWAAALLLISVFIVVQSVTLDYGTRINQISFIRDYHIASDVVRGSALERTAVIGAQEPRAETLDRAMLRFKLYTTDADEVDNVMALARIKPAQLQFDPHFYQYGGAFLYPLGIYYAALAKLGVLSVGSLDNILANPQAINRVWIAGRAFVLLAAAASGVLLYLALLQFAPPPIALLGLVIYLFCPATVMFSQVLKPHWYALLFGNAALLIMARAVVQARLSRASQVALAIVLGLAVGSVPTFALFAILTWCALLFLYWRGGKGASALFLIPAIAIVVFIVSNPYYLIDWRAVLDERSAQAGWFAPQLNVGLLTSFVRNSILSGFGVVLTPLFFAVLARHLLRPAPMGVRLLGVGIVLPLIVMAAITANMYFWHTNFRYVSYILPLMIVFLAIQPLPYRTVLFAITAAATIVQAAPLKLAYFDENSDAHSTRLAAATWIDAHLPPDAAICVSTPTPAPYNVPPFRFERHAINSPDCKWKVETEANPQTASAADTWQIARQFRPRLSPSVFPLVWENINPQITVYRRR
jgi:MFS family permease